MKVNLSSFLQMRCNVFLFRKLSWDLCVHYIYFLGKLYFFFNRRERARIAESVEEVFARRRSRELETIITNVFRGVLSHYYEKIFNAYEDLQGLKEFFRTRIEAKDLNKLDHALSRKNGVLFVTGHYGGIEYIPIYLAAHAYPISVIAKFKTQHLKETLYNKTNKLGLRIIDAAEKNTILGAIIHEIKENRIVFIECDEIEEWKPSRAEKMYFLGRMIGVDRTIGLIQRRTGAEVVFGLLHRFTLQKYSLIIKNYRDMGLNGHSDRSLVGKAILRHLEQYIYTYPEQWYQWKNYSEIKEVFAPQNYDEKVKPLRVLRPVLGESI